MSTDLYTSFRVLQALTRLRTADLERLNNDLKLADDSSFHDGPVRKFVVRLANVYRGSQLARALLQRKHLRHWGSHFQTWGGRARERGANSAGLGFLAINVPETTKSEDFETAYRAWEIELGIETTAAEELPVYKGPSVLALALAVYVLPSLQLWAIH